MHTACKRAKQSLPPEKIIVDVFIIVSFFNSITYDWNYSYHFDMQWASSTTIAHTRLDTRGFSSASLHLVFPAEPPNIWICPYFNGFTSFYTVVHVTKLENTE